LFNLEGLLKSMGFIGYALRQLRRRAVGSMIRAQRRLGKL